MCLKWFKGWFKRKKSGETPKTTTVTSTITQPERDMRPAALVLPHPEESMNPLQTVANTTVSDVLSIWFQQWDVPGDSQDYFSHAIEIQLFDSWPTEIIARFRTNPETPAFTFQDSIRHLYSLAKWFNAGVVAHEQAHNSYALLTGDEKRVFSEVYTPLISTDPYIKLLYSRNTYGLTSTIEGHAEVYRYLGDKMPAVLMQFYPRLFR